MRLDEYLYVKKHVKSRSQANDLIKRGLVKVNEKIITRASYNVEDGIDIFLLEELYVSRGAYKLKEIIEYFKINLEEKTIIDVGASTGGFTDLALKLGAKLVYAYDVGTNQLDKSLRENPKVLSFEQTNILDVELPKADFCLIDVSFTSIKPIISHVAKNNYRILGLIKPQFEVGSKYLKKGIVKDQKIVNHTINNLRNYFIELDYQVVDIIAAKTLGKEGNQEYLFYLIKNRH